MTDEYAQYEKACEVIRAENKVLLAGFAEWLGEKGLSAKTIDKHVLNCGIYINSFLLYSEAVPAKDGAREIGMFLGYWLIKKALWAHKNTIRSCAASLKKFYKFMHEKGMVDEQTVEYLKEDIREFMPEWLETMDRWDDPENDDPFNTRFL